MNTSEISRLSKAQQAAMANVAFGGQGAGCNPRTLAALERKGLIESHEVSDKTFGQFTWKVWEMPIAIHMIFCAWCSEDLE